MERFPKLQLGTHIHMLETQQQPGLGSRGRTGPGSGPLATSFVVPGYPEAATVSPVFEYGFQVVHLKTVPWPPPTTKSLSSYKIDMARSIVSIQLSSTKAK